VSPDEKGKLLERAVHAIEEAILKSFPGYNDAAFHVSRRKILVVEGVRHEYDVWVEVDLGPGYKPIFVFECKNWEDKIGKNEIIIFSEKIAAAQAQHGYFVARAYTADAIAQAAKDPRVRLLTMRELPGDAAAFLNTFHVLGIDNERRTISVEGPPEQEDALARCSFSSATGSLHGEPVNLEAYAAAWGEELRESHNRTFPSNRMPEGVYKIGLKDVQTFAAGDFIVDGLSVLELRMKLTFDVHIVWPRIRSTVEVRGRGRVAFCEPVEVPGARMEFALIGIDRDGGAAEPRVVADGAAPAAERDDVRRTSEP